MRKNWMMLILVLLISVVSVHASSPARCIFVPEIRCIDYYSNPKNNQLNFTISSNIYEPMTAHFNASIAHENLSSVSCLCNGMDSCIIDNNKTVNVICIFPEGMISRESYTKFYLEGSYVLASDPSNPKSVMGNIFSRPYQHLYSNPLNLNTILYLIISVLLLILLIFMVVWIGRCKKINLWLGAGLKGFFIALAVLFVLVSWAEFPLGEGIGNVRPFGACLFALSLALLPALLLGIVVSIFSYFRYKHKK